MSDFKITVIYDNRKDNCCLQEGWGFSCLIERKGQKILFDTGADRDAFFSNTQKLGIEYDEITHVVFSHKHFDHVAGFEEVLQRLKSGTPIYLPRSFPFSLRKKIPPTLQINKISSFEEIATGLYSLVARGGLFLYEQALAFKSSHGLVVITGCAHPGALSIVQDFKERVAEKIYLVMGGFHLFRASKEEADDLVRQFQSLGVKKAAPCHCSGDQTIHLFQESYGEDFVRIGTGTIIEE